MQDGSFKCNEGAVDLASKGGPGWQSARWAVELVADGDPVSLKDLLLVAHNIFISAVVGRIFKNHFLKRIHWRIQNIFVRHFNANGSAVDQVRLAL